MNLCPFVSDHEKRFMRYNKRGQPPSPENEAENYRPSRFTPNALPVPPPLPSPPPWQKSEDAAIPLPCGQLIPTRRPARPPTYLPTLPRSPPHPSKLLLCRACARAFFA